MSYAAAARSRANAAIDLLDQWLADEQQREDILAEVRAKNPGIRLITLQRSAKNYPAMLRQLAGLIVQQHRIYINRKQGCPERHTDAIAAWQLVSKRVLAVPLFELAYLVDIAAAATERAAARR